MKKILEYGQLLAFLVLAFWCFDSLKEKFKSKETGLTEEYKEKIKNALSSNDLGHTQPTELLKQTENKVENKTESQLSNYTITRDPNLIGTWSKFSKYTRNSMNSDENWVFNSDGTMAVLSHSYAIINDNFEGSIDYDWIEDAAIKAEKEAGYRWFTKDNDKVFYKAPDGSEILLFYYSIEYYYGKINMFTSQNPNQENPSASLTKIN